MICGMPVSVEGGNIAVCVFVLLLKQPHEDLPCLSFKCAENELFPACSSCLRRTTVRPSSVVGHAKFTCLAKSRSMKHSFPVGSNEIEWGIVRISLWQDSSSPPSGSEC